MDEKRMEIINSYIAKKLNTNHNGHGQDHARRVHKIIIKLLNYFPESSIELCCVSGLVHDLIDDKVTDDINLEAKNLKVFLASLGYTEPFIKDVFFIIQNMSYRKQKKGIFVNLIEGQIVQDADRLDAIGAIGVARAFMYGGTNGNEIYKEGDYTNQTIIGHFHAKLYKISDELNTAPAKDIALKRIAFIRNFEKNIISEIEGEI